MSYFLQNLVSSLVYLQTLKTSFEGPNFQSILFRLFQSLVCCLDFMNGVGQPLEAELGNLSSWMERMKGRASAAASLHPGAAETGMQG